MQRKLLYRDQNLHDPEVGLLVFILHTPKENLALLLLYLLFVQPTGHQPYAF